MRVILTGSRSFGVATLEAVVEDGHDVVYVESAPDDKLTWRAESLGYKTTDGLRAEEVERAEADVILGAHSHRFVGRKSRDMTRLGALGYHPSLLPLHRGRDAVRWTTRMREPIAGGSVYWFNDRVDGGPIAAQDWCFVRPGWSANDLWAEELFPMGVRLIRKVLADLDAGRLVSIPQDEALATVEPAFDAPRLYRPELPAIGAGPAGFEVIAHRDDPRLRAFEVY